MLEQTTDLSGYQVEYFDGVDWIPYYTFASEEPLLTGTIMH